MDAATYEQNRLKHMQELIEREERANPPKPKVVPQPIVRRHRGGARPPKYKPVTALLSDGTPDPSHSWPSVVAAAAALGVTPTAISEAMRNGHRCRGLRIALVGRRPARERPMRNTPVIRLSDGQWFDSVSKVVKLFTWDAGAFHNEHHRFTRAIRDGRPYHGHVYAYADPAQADAETPCGRIGPQRSAVLADGQRRSV